MSRKSSQVNMLITHSGPEYERLPSASSPAGVHLVSRTWIITSLILTSILAFTSGGLSVYLLTPAVRVCPSLESVAPRVPIPLIAKEFEASSPFLKEPPQGNGAGEVSEPIWDALIPNGLGYFKDPDIAPQTSIPTVFHQLHCLYLLRRAYYSRSGEDLERFDFGRNRTIHVAHCFAYLQQGLTCSVDTTVEPAVDKEHGFLGSGFMRECRDFEALKNFVQTRRVFNATGFLAAGLEQ